MEWNFPLPSNKNRILFQGINGEESLTLWVEGMTYSPVENKVYVFISRDLLFDTYGPEADKLFVARVERSLKATDSALNGPFDDEATEPK